MASQIEEVLLKYSEELTKNDFVKLERSLRKLFVALAEHSNFIAKHTTAVENLTQAVTQLNMTIKKDSKLEPRRISLHLTETITSFMEYNINPMFYNDKNILKLNAATPKRQTESLNENRPRGIDKLDHELKNLYTNILKDAFTDSDLTNSSDGGSSTKKHEKNNK